ncbi:MAG TPA: hypothetical protein VGN12_16500 [Pirellulales bacterium]|jgi:threonine dehydrogenase-like Zn-dependent dehydrogenase
MLASALAVVGLGVLGAIVLGARKLKVSQMSPIDRNEQALKFAQQLFHRESLDQLTTDEARQVQHLIKEFFI